MISFSVDKTVLAAAFLALSAVPARAKTPVNWDLPTQWNLNQPNNVTFEVKDLHDDSRGDYLEVKFAMNEGGWVEMSRDLKPRLALDVPITFFIKADTDVKMELKFSDADGSVFGRRVILRDKYKEWTQVVVYPGDAEYWWNGDNKLEGVDKFYIAFAGLGSGTVLLDGLAPGKPGMTSSFQALSTIDPDRELSGYGFRQRREKELKPEDPGVLAWLKQQQDLGSPERLLVPSMEDSLGQTYNNAIVAMAFILKGERKRAERILDYYARATDRNNKDKFKQNFFYQGEARGFFQQVFLRNDQRPAYHAPPGADRWIGDMAWLGLAYKYYEKEYKSKRYKEISTLIADLLTSYYVSTGKDEGYIAHGWRNDDAKLHESSGHQEGNIDCYAMFKSYGNKDMAGRLKRWIDDSIKATNLPLDLYSWRVLALGKDPQKLLDTVEFDFKFRKKLNHSGREVMGFYSFPMEEVNNIWIDGTGHIACGYFASGRTTRGIFYANQMDAFVFDRAINGVKTRALPYSANQEGDYRWVDVKKGAASAAVWYIFAKNGFDPLTLTKYSTR